MADPIQLIATYHQYARDGFLSAKAASDFAQKVARGEQLTPSDARQLDAAANLKAQGKRMYRYEPGKAGRPDVSEQATKKLQAEAKAAGITGDVKVARNAPTPAEPEPEKVGAKKAGEMFADENAGAEAASQARDAKKAPTKPAEAKAQAKPETKASTKARAKVTPNSSPATLKKKIEALRNRDVISPTEAKRLLKAHSAEDYGKVITKLNEYGERPDGYYTKPNQKASLTSTMKKPPAADIPEPKVGATGESPKAAPTPKATGTTPKATGTTPKAAPKVAATGESPASLGAQTSGYDKTIGLPDPESPGGVRPENTGVFRESAGERIAHTPEGPAKVGPPEPRVRGTLSAGRRTSLLKKGFSPEYVSTIDDDIADGLLGENWKNRTPAERQALVNSRNRQVGVSPSAATPEPGVSSTGRPLPGGEAPAPTTVYPDKVTPRSTPGQPTPNVEPRVKLTGASLGEPTTTGAALADELTGRMEAERILGPEAMGRKPLALGPAGSTGNGLNVLPVADEAAPPLIRQTSGGLGAQLGGGIDDVERLAQNAMAADAAAEAAKRGPLKRFLMGNLGKGAAAEAEAGLAAQAARAAAVEGGLTAAGAPAGAAASGGGALKNLLLGGKSLMSAAPYMAAGIGTEMAGRALAEQIDDNDTDSWLGGAAKAVLPMAAGGAVAGSAGGLPGAAIGALLASGIGLGSYVLGGGPDRIKDVIPAEQIAMARKYGRRSGTDPALVQALVTRYAMDAAPLEAAGDQEGLIALTKNLQTQLGTVMGTPVPYSPVMDPAVIGQLAQYGNEAIAPYLGQMSQSDAANMMKVMQMAPFTMYNQQVQDYGLPQPNTLQSLGLGGGAIGGGGLGGGLNLDTLAQVAGKQR